MKSKKIESIHKFEWSRPEKIKALSKTPFGKKLIEEVCTKLELGYKLGETMHRDYCGYCLMHDGYGNYILFRIEDYTVYNTMIWRHRDDFVNFMAEQSDYTMSGADRNVPELYESDLFYVNNLTINRKRLIDFVNKEL